MRSGAKNAEIQRSIDTGMCRFAVRGAVDSRLRRGTVEREQRHDRTQNARLRRCPASLANRRTQKLKRKLNPRQSSLPVCTARGMVALRWKSGQIRSRTGENSRNAAHWGVGGRSDRGPGTGGSVGVRRLVQRAGRGDRRAQPGRELPRPLHPRLDLAAPRRHAAGVRPPGRPRRRTCGPAGRRGALGECLRAAPGVRAVPGRDARPARTLRGARSPGTRRARVRERTLLRELRLRSRERARARGRSRGRARRSRKL